MAQQDLATRAEIPLDSSMGMEGAFLIGVGRMGTP